MNNSLAAIFFSNLGDGQNIKGLTTGLSNDRPVSGGASFESFLAQAVPGSILELLESNPDPVLQPQSESVLSSSNNTNTVNRLPDNATNGKLIFSSGLQELTKPDGITSFNNKIQLERNIENGGNYTDRFQIDIDPQIVSEGDIKPIVIPLQQSLATINLPELFNNQDTEHLEYNLELELPTDLETKGTDQSVIIYARLVPIDDTKESTFEKDKSEVQPELGGYFVIDVEQLIRIIKPQLPNISSVNENSDYSKSIDDYKSQDQQTIIPDLPVSEKEDLGSLTDNLNLKFGKTEELKSIIGELKSYYSEQFSRIENQSNELIPVSGINDDYQVKLDSKTGKLTIDRVDTSLETDTHEINNNGIKENIRVPIKLGSQPLIQLLEIAAIDQPEVIINELTLPGTNEGVQLAVKPDNISHVLQRLLSTDNNDTVFDSLENGEILAKDLSTKLENAEPIPSIKILIKSLPKTIAEASDFSGYDYKTSENIKTPENILKSGLENPNPEDKGRNESPALKILDIPEELGRKIIELHSSGKEELSFSVELTIKDEDTESNVKIKSLNGDVLEKLVKLTGKQDKPATLISGIDSLPPQIAKDIQSLKIELNLAGSPNKTKLIENIVLQPSGSNSVFTDNLEINSSSKDNIIISNQPVQPIGNRSTMTNVEDISIEFNRADTVQKGDNIVITLKEQLTGNRNQKIVLKDQPDFGFVKNSHDDALKPDQTESKIRVSINKGELSNLLARQKDTSEDIKIQVTLIKDSQAKPAFLKISHEVVTEILEPENNYKNANNRLNAGKENLEISENKIQLSGKSKSEIISKDVSKSFDSSLRGKIEINDLVRAPIKVDSSNEFLKSSDTSVKEINDLVRTPVKLDSPKEILENSVKNYEPKRPLILRIPVQNNYASSEGDESVDTLERTDSKVSKVNSGGGKIFSNEQNNLLENVRKQVETHEAQTPNLLRDKDINLPKNIPVIIETDNPEHNGAKVQGMLIIKNPDRSKNGPENFSSDTILEEISEERHPGQIQSLDEEKFGTSRQKGDLLPKGNSNDNVNAPKQLFEIQQDKVISTQTILEYTTKTEETTKSGSPAPVFNVDDLADQMVRHAKLNVKKGVSELSIQLKPPHLGKMAIHIKIENNQLLASIRVDTAEAKQLVQDNLHQLRETMSERGVEIQKFDVSVNQEFRDQMNLYKWNSNEYKQNGNNGNKYSRNNQSAQTPEAAFAYEETTRRFGYNTMELIA